MKAEGKLEVYLHLGIRVRARSALCLDRFASLEGLPITHEAGWALEPVWDLRRERSLLSLQGILRILGRLACSLVSVPNMLRRIRKPYRAKI
jgi:hypothetical protein